MISAAGRCQTCIRRAFELEVITADPWPPAQRGRSRRKVNRTSSAVDIRLLPAQRAAVSIIKALRSHQPGSLNYQMMSAVVYLAALRPSETAMLRPRVLYLPAQGWGKIAVVEADDGWDEPVEPKTGPRDVPIPPQLVALLGGWITAHDLGSDDLLFRTRGDKRPSQSNWARALGRACKTAGHRRIRVYDFRHEAATMWIREGVALGEAARRLGHSVETLVSTYIGAMEGDESEANSLLGRVVPTLELSEKETQ
jgi:integrase